MLEWTFNDNTALVADFTHNVDLEFETADVEIPFDDDEDV